MSLMEKNRGNLRENVDLKPRDFRHWAKYPRSQKAVDLMFSYPPMTEEINFARENGYIVGDRWVPPQNRKKPS